MKRFVIVLGIVFAIAGLGAGCSPLSVSENGVSAKCGNAFDDLGHGTALGQDSSNQLGRIFNRSVDETHFVDKCVSKQDTYKILAFAPGILGAALIIAGFFIPTRKPEGVSA